MLQEGAQTIWRKRLLQGPLFSLHFLLTTELFNWSSIINHNWRYVVEEYILGRNSTLMICPIGYFFILQEWVSAILRYLWSVIISVIGHTTSQWFRRVLTALPYWFQSAFKFVIASHHLIWPLRCLSMFSDNSLDTYNAFKISCLDHYFRFCSFYEWPLKWAVIN